MIYCRIFSTHIWAKDLKKWNSTPVGNLNAKAWNLVEALGLNLLKEILDTIKNKTKYRVIQNSPVGKVSKEKRDKVLGFLINNPGIMTRSYN